MKFNFLSNSNSVIVSVCSVFPIMFLWFQALFPFSLMRLKTYLSPYVFWHRYPAMLNISLADSVAWLAENGGQAALTAAVKGNVDATFACLAAMDGAETVSAYARFNCTVRYDAASDEYIVVVLYG